MSETLSGRFSVQPSAICSTGPTPFTKLSLDMVTGISAFVIKREEKPPPRKYPKSAAFQVVASIQVFQSTSLTSQNGFITLLPSLSFISPEASTQAAPE